MPASELPAFIHHRPAAHRFGQREGLLQCPPRTRGDVGDQTAVYDITRNSGTYRSHFPGMNDGETVPGRPFHRMWRNVSAGAIRSPNHGPE